MKFFNKWYILVLVPVWLVALIYIVSNNSDLFNSHKEFLESILTVSVLFSFIILHTANAQVGIGTPTPRKSLEIAGDMKISQAIEVQNVKDLSNSATSTFLLQESDNSIKAIDASNPTGAALGYFQEYIIINPNLDWVKDFDTGIDAVDFVLVVTSAVYNTDLQLSNSGNNSQVNSMIP